MTQQPDKRVDDEGALGGKHGVADVEGRTEKKSCQCGQGGFPGKAPWKAEPLR
uniref:Uncharacterized protein n=1 Tax=uncultured prokaryote TaxID=198431 RepID=A0A0H5QK89_9ZZZZ|nr:hypothetical protein [uncultured prokaryote]